ncbi:fimbrial protein [Aeromonas piscicola]
MNMKRSSIAAAMLIAVFANVAHAETNQGSGTVEFVGSIIDAPCSISPETADQTVSMGQVSNASLDVNGQGIMNQFDIKLEGCVLETAQSVDVKFTGAADADAATDLALQGEAKGAAIELKNMSTGEKIELDKATSITGLMDGTNSLKFGATLVKTAADKSGITPGEFNATADFVLSYK